MNDELKQYQTEINETEKNKMNSQQEHIAVGFNLYGKEQFEDWFNQISKHGEISSTSIQAYFDSLAFANWDTESNTTIEVAGYATKSGNPTTFLATREMVEFVNE